MFLYSPSSFSISTNWSRFSQKQTLSLGTTYPLWLQSFQMILFFMVKSIKIDGHQSAPSLVTKTSLVFTVMSWHFCQQKGAKNCLPKKDKKKEMRHERKKKKKHITMSLYSCSFWILNEFLMSTNFKKISIGHKKSHIHKARERLIFSLKYLWNASIQNWVATYQPLTIVYIQFGSRSFEL